MRGLRATGALIVAVGLFALGQPPAGAVTLPSQDAFYTYSGTTPLARIAPGTVLKTRTVTVAFAGVNTLAYRATQLLYRTTTQLGAPAVTVTSVIKPLVPVFAQPRLVSFQIAYDALDSKCDPSYFLAGGFNTAGSVNTGEQGEIMSLLTQGYTITTSDYEGTDLAWVAGGQSGRQTLDGIRATFNSADVGLPATTKVALTGYSGGAIASEWAAELAPKYAPDVNSKLVGVAIGGVAVDLAHNLQYVDGTPIWSGVIPGALTGIARGFGIDVHPYASAVGEAAFTNASTKCIPELLGQPPGVTFASLTKPQYSTLAKVPVFARTTNALIMSSGGTPSIPLLIEQGTGAGADPTGAGAEGTPGNKPGIGPGDGVMVAGDVRTLARTYCQRGLSVQYNEVPGDHITVLGLFSTAAQPWIADRFNSVAVPQNCAGIPVGNSIAPLAVAATPVTTAPSRSRPGSGSGTTSRAGATDPVANTGTRTQQLLLWALLLVGLGAGLQWGGLRNGQAVTVASMGGRRPSPGPRIMALTDRAESVRRPSPRPRPRPYA